MTMKIIALTLSIGSVCFSQTNWEEYYPLHIGNLWEFSDVTPIPLTLTREVISDTLMPNGKVYKVIEQFYHDGPHPGRAGPLQYERIDSLGNVFAYVEVACKFPEWADTLIYKLAGRVGDSIKAVCRLPDTFWLLAQKGTILMFEDEELREFSHFELNNDVVRGVKTIVQGFGLIYYGYEGGEMYLRGAIVNGKKYGDITVSVQDPDRRADIPLTFELFQNYPNPFNSTTSIKYRIYQPGLVDISVYSVEGKKVCTLFKGRQFSGEHELRWNGMDSDGIAVSSGLYLIQVFSRGSFQVRKALYVK
jgi:FlgD Ig-like domain